LCYAVNGRDVAFASESVALQNIGFNEINDLSPGEMSVIRNGKHEIKRFAECKRKAHCFFEWVYFAHPASIIEKKLVYEVRNNLGKELAKIEKEKIDNDCVVVPVPDSSTPVGEGFSDSLGIPLKGGLIRNRYIGRTFIESSDRAEKVKDKFTVVKQFIDNKKVFLIEDSIVRGTTLKNLVEYIKRVANPKEIHVRVSCPPIKWPCFYGIDMSSKKELIAAQEENNEKLVEKIKKEIGVDSVVYQSFNGLISALGLDEKDLCTACLTGNYPTKWGEKLKGFSESGRACGK
jgi:amidophosphoribosyltransferase